MTALISVNPNPFTDQLEILIDHESREPSDYVIALSDARGHLHKMAGVTVEKGLTTILLNELLLPEGIYFLEIKNTDGRAVFNRKLTKAQIAG